MALALKDRVKETTTTTGTGTVTLAGAAAGFQSFAAVGDGNQTFYAIVDSTSGDWEVGVGTYTSSGTTLSRTTVVSSSNAGSLVPFGAGSKDVFVTYPSSRAVYLDAAGSAVTNLDIGTLGASTANITTANITAGTITTTPTNNTDIVNKEYADAIASGIHFHEAVDYATTAALPAATYNNGTGGVNATLTGNVNGALTVDGYTFTSPADNGMRILVKNQANGAENGVYTLSQAGNSSPGAPFILTRATDFDSVGTGVDQIDEGDFFLVTSGTANVNTAWVQQTPPPITIGTTAIVFQQFSAPITYTAGTGLSESPSYTFNIANIGTAGTYGSASSVPVITTNAQGQVTGVTPTAIAITGAAVSGNIAGSAGSVANALTAGTYLTSGGTYDGSAARTFAVDATNANTASKVVARDASGNFSAGTITATLSGAATSATTATNLAGGAANQLAYQTGAGATTFAVAPSASNQVLNWNGSAFTWSAGTISGVPLGSNLNSLTAGTYLTGTAYNGSGAQTWTVDATSANTASKVVARDASGNFSAGTITAALSGNATTATTATKLAGGAQFSLPYQTSSGNTAFISIGPSGRLLQSNGTFAEPSWVTAPVVNNGTLTMNVSGTGLSGSQTFTANQSGNATFTVTSNATNANTASTIVARDSNGDFSAGGITTTRSLLDQSGSNASLRVLSPAGAAFYGSSGFANGAIKIRFPTTLLNSMFRMRVTVFTYGGQSFDLFVGAYIYAGGVANPFAYVISQTNVAVNTRWGWDGTYVSLFIGSIPDSWSYPNVSVTDVQVGYGAVTTSAVGWLITFEASSYGTVLSGPTAASSFASTATTATNLAGGSAGTIPYQSAAGTTVQLAAGSSGQFLRSNGAAAPSWAAVSVAAATPSVLGTVYAKQDTSSSYQAFGYLALNSVTSGTFNTAVGQQALQNITSGNQNTAVGHQSIFSASSSGGANNTAIGYQTLWSNSSGSNNLAGGLQALYNNTTGSSNIAEGFRALYTNTTSSYNLGIGYEALYNLNSSSSGFNTVVGYNAGRAATQSSFCSIFGTYTAQNITSGSNNTVIGTYAGNGLTTGSGNVIIGSLNSSGSVSTPFNVTTESNRVVIGTASTTNAYVQVAWTAVSDARDKTDFAPVPHGLDFVTKLKPTAYRFKESRDATEGHGPLRYGFKAQDILELEGDNPVVIDAGTPEKLYFNDQNLLAILVKAVQEQQVIIDQLKADVAALKGN